MNAPKTFTIRACGADRKLQQSFVAKFPLNDVAPDLREEGTAWSMIPKDDVEDQRRQGMPANMVLEEQPGEPAYMGQLEGGMRDVGASYFLLVRNKNTPPNEFAAVPVDEWYTFKPVSKRQALSLDDAEAEMKAQRERGTRASNKLAQSVNAEDDAGELLAAARDEEEEEADSDEEWKDIRARTAARQAIKARPAPVKAKVAKGVDDEGEEEVHVEEAQGEDWDHEHEAADDDLQQGSDEEDGGGAETTPQRPRPDSDDEGDLRPSQVHRRLKRMMRETGLEGSEDEEEEGASEEEEEEESESIEDDEDLDRMAGEVLPGEAPTRKRERSPSPTSAAAIAADAGTGKKRKSPSPAGAAEIAARAEQAAAAKRTRMAPAAAAAAGTAATAAAAAAAGPVTDSVSGITGQEVKQLLRQKGRMVLGDVVAHFKPRLAPDSHKAFVALIAKMARLDTVPSADGKKYLVARD